MKKPKYIKLYEEFDLDQFLANPSANFGNSAEGEIEEGDWVKSYRGTGMVLKMNDEFAMVALKGSKGNVVKVPVFSLTKITRPEGSEPKDTADRLAAMAQTLGEYVAVIQGDEESEFVNNPDSVLDYIETEVLLDVINLIKADPDAASYPEYDDIVSKVALLLDLVRHTDPSTDERVHNILEKFYELSQ